jgi:hypothetical protein
VKLPLVFDSCYFVVLTHDHVLGVKQVRVGIVWARWVGKIVFWVERLRVLFSVLTLIFIVRLVVLIVIVVYVIVVSIVAFLKKSLIVLNYIFYLNFTLEFLDFFSTKDLLKIKIKFKIIVIIIFFHISLLFLVL